MSLSKGERLAGKILLNGFLIASAAGFAGQVDAQTPELPGNDAALEAARPYRQYLPVIDVPNICESTTGAIPGRITPVAFEGGMYYRIHPDYGTFPPKKPPSDGARSLWAEGNTLILGEWGGPHSRGIVRSRDGGCSWGTVVDKTAYEQTGVPRDFFRHSEQLLVAADEGVIALDESGAWDFYPMPAELGFLQTGRTLQDGTIIVGGLWGIARTADLETWEVSTGIPQEAMVRTIAELPGTSTILAGGWSEQTKHRPQGNNLWISHDGGSTFRTADELFALTEQAGLERHINSIFATDVGGRLLVFVGSEGYFNISPYTNPRGLPAFMGFEYDRQTGAFSPLNINYPDLFKKLGGTLDLIAPARGIDRAGDALVVSTYGSGVAQTSLQSILAGSPQWNTLMPKEASAGLMMIANGQVYTGGNTWVRNDPYWPVHSAPLR